MTRRPIPFTLLAAALSAVVALGCASAADAPLPSPPLGDPSLVIAYTSESGTDCSIVVSTLDGQRRTLSSTCGTHVSWSPDGRRIAFDRAGGEAMPPSLWVMNADGSGEVAVPGGGALASPEWSPDATRLATAAPGYEQFVIVRPDGTGRRSLAATQGTGSFDQPSWSPDGSSLLFARRDTLWAVDVESDVARVLAVPGLKQLHSPRWAPDGHRVSFVARGAAGIGLYVMNVDGSTVRVVAEGAIESSGAWSPDGQRLAYSAARGTGATVDVFVVPSDGSAPPSNITHNVEGQASIMPDWVRGH